MKGILDFRFDRYLKLLRNEMKFNHKGILIIAAGTFVLLTLLSFVVSERTGHDGEFMNIWYGITLMFGGFYYTSIAFRELNRQDIGHLYLMTPASILEKFLSKWTLTTVGFVLAHLVIYTIFSMVALSIDSYSGHTYFNAFEPFGHIPVLLMKLYLTLSSLFLLGSVAFRKYEFFKIQLVLNLFGIVLTFIGAFLFRIIFNQYFEGMQFSPQMNNIVIEPEHTVKAFIEGPLWTALQFLFWLGLPLLLWTVAFFKLKEQEV
ncbi:MAG: hypothetical protein ACI85O_000666 [Saprospiraceae bacterium]|jgi:hypothetical protein